MSKVTAPLLSFGASGQIAKTQVYAEWKGRPYVRRHVIPANPRTAEQTLTRDTFSFLNNVWRYMPAAAVDAWDAYALTSRFTARNGWIKRNLSTLRTASDLMDMILSPAAYGGVPAAAIGLTPGTDKITVALTAPTPPTGWTIAKGHAIAIRDQDPQSGVLYTVAYGDDATAPYSFDISGLETGEDYVVGGWFSYTRPDGSTAYGEAINDTAQPS